MIALDPREKERLVEEFRIYLEQCITEPAENETAENKTAENETREQPVDLRTLLGEMAALKNEVRLESRQYKSALDELRGFGEALREHNERLVQDLDRLRRQAAETQRQTERRLLLGLLDVHDRLQAGADAAAATRSFAFARFLAPGPTRVARSLIAGTQLTLQRLDDLLAAHRVRPIETLGQALDPRTMCAVATEAARGAPEGSVLREARRGFTHGGELLRAAEVIVNKKATSS